MKQDLNHEIAIRNELIKSLEREGIAKDKLVQAQKDMIQALESHILELQNLIEEMLPQQDGQKG